MKRFNMQDVKVQDLKFGRGVPALECDAGGRLFDARARDHVQRMPGTEHDHAVFEAIGAMHAANHILHNLMDRWMSEHGLSEGRMRLLFLLRGDREHNLSELADTLGVSPRNITGLVDMLERDGLVERVPDQEDRRAVRARLTPAGGEKLREVGAQMLEARRLIAAGLTDDELATLRHLCLRLVENLRRVSPDKGGDR
jgi:DNA-binding MarR family transcriptional regulator